MIIITISRLTLQLEIVRMSVGELAVSMELFSMPQQSMRLQDDDSTMKTPLRTRASTLLRLKTLKR